MSLTTETPLQEWVDAHVPDDGLLWKQGLGDQVEFVRDRLWYMLGNRWGEHRDSNPPLAVSTHHSKSVTLPVFEVRSAEWASGRSLWEARAPQVRLRMRHNFFDWVVSVDSAQHITDRFRDLFDREAVTLPMYAEGFPESWVYGPYAEDRKKFTVTLPTKYEVNTFCWLLMQ